MSDSNYSKFQNIENKIIRLCFSSSIDDSTVEIHEMLSKVEDQKINGIKKKFNFNFFKGPPFSFFLYIIFFQNCIKFFQAFFK
jgi:hypothetical protein